MAGKFPMDLSKFKKVASDKATATLRHPDGHEIKVAMGALSPKMRLQLHELPVHKAEGGDVVKDDIPEPNSTVAAQVQKGATSPGTTLKEGYENIKKSLGFAKGGPIAPQQPQLAPNAVGPGQMEKNSLRTNHHKMADGGKVAEYAEGTQDYPVSPADANGPSLMDSNSQVPVSPQSMNAANQLNEEQTAAAGAPPTAAESLSAPQQQDNTAPPTNSAPSDPYGANAYYANLEKGIGEQTAGIAGEREAASTLAAAQKKALQSSTARQNAMMNDYSANTKSLNDERAAFLNDYKNQHIDENRYLGNMDTGSKIATGIGLILGGVGAGLTHGPNMGMQMLQSQIDRDIDTQKAQLGQKNNLLAANMQQYGNLRDATEMTRVMMNDVVAHKLQLAATQAADPMAKARAEQMLGQLHYNTAQAVAQGAARKTALNGLNNGNMDPATAIRFIIPEGPEQAAATKELGEAQNSAALRANVLNDFDRLVKVNTLGNRAMHPIDASAQVNAIRGAALDKLTKDTSGRVTPETVKLIGGLFAGAGQSAETNAVQRQQLLQVLSQNQHYPTMEKYGLKVPGTAAPVPFKKR